MEENKNEVTKDNKVVEVNEWLEKINEETAQKAKELELLLNCEIVPFVFVVEDGKDAAVGFLRKPDPKQAMKILRQMGTDYDAGLELIARAQLIRKHGDQNVSDTRFMDEGGKSDPKNNDLNLSLLMKSGTLIQPFSDQFKKK